MLNSWVLIFITTSTFGPLNIQPIYFYTQEACEAVAVAFLDKNGKPQGNFAAVCKPTR